MKNIKEHGAGNSGGYSGGHSGHMGHPGHSGHKGHRSNFLPMGPVCWDDNDPRCRKRKKLLKNIGPPAGESKAKRVVKMFRNIEGEY